MKIKLNINGIYENVEFDSDNLQDRFYLMKVTISHIDYIISVITSVNTNDILPWLKKSLNHNNTIRNINGQTESISFTAIIDKLNKIKISMEIEANFDNEIYSTLLNNILFISNDLLYLATRIAELALESNYIQNEDSHKNEEFLLIQLYSKIISIK